LKYYFPTYNQEFDLNSEDSDILAMMDYFNLNFDQMEFLVGNSSALFRLVAATETIFTQELGMQVCQSPATCPLPAIFYAQFINQSLLTSGINFGVYF
jgi:hypothetical protein